MSPPGANAIATGVTPNVTPEAISSFAQLLSGKLPFSIINQFDIYHEGLSIKPESD